MNFLSVYTEKSISYAGYVDITSMLTTVHATDQKITYEMIQTKPFKPHLLDCVYTLDKSAENFFQTSIVTYELSSIHY